MMYLNISFFNLVSSLRCMVAAVFQSTFADAPFSFICFCHPGMNPGVIHVEPFQGYNFQILINLHLSESRLETATPILAFMHSYIHSLSLLHRAKIHTSGTAQAVAAIWFVILAFAENHCI